MNEPTSRYLHGTDPREQRRLGLMNALLNEGSLRELGLRGGETIIDFGCGLGQFTRIMARGAGPGGRVLGIERSPEQIAAARRLAREAGEEDLIDLRQGEAAAPPLEEAEWGTFDIAHARFLLEHVPDPQGVVRAMVHAVRPGGRVVLEDDDHDVLRLWPEPPGAVALWRAYMRAFEHHGNDPTVGRRLVALLHDAGAAPRRSTWIFFGGSAGMPSFPTLVENFLGLLEGVRETILSAGLLERAAFDEACDAIRAWGRRPEAAMWFGMCWAEGIRPG